MYLLAAACLDNSRVVAVPFQGKGSLFVDLDPDDRAGVMHIARRPSTPGGHRLSLSFAGLSDDGMRVEGSANLSWGKYVIGHAQSALVDSESGSSVQVRSASALGSAILCQLHWLTPHALRSKAAAVCEDQALACQSIQRTRADTLLRLKVAFRELIMTETFCLEGDPTLRHAGR